MAEYIKEENEEEGDTVVKATVTSDAPDTLDPAPASETGEKVNGEAIPESAVASVTEEVIGAPPEEEEDDDEDLFGGDDDDDAQEESGIGFPDAAPEASTTDVERASAAPAVVHAESVNCGTKRTAEESVELSTETANEASIPRKAAKTHEKSSPTSQVSLSPSDYGLPASVRIPPSISSSLLNGKLLDVLKSLPANLINDALTEYDDAVEVKGSSIRNHGAYLYGVIKRYVSVHDRVVSGEGAGILPMGESLTPTIISRLEDLVISGFCTREEMNEKVKSKIRMLSERDAICALDELASVDAKSIRNLGSYVIGILHRYMRGDPPAGVGNSFPNNRSSNVPSSRQHPHPPRMPDPQFSRYRNDSSRPHPQFNPRDRSRDRPNDSFQKPFSHQQQRSPHPPPHQQQQQQQLRQPPQQYTQPQQPPSQMFPQQQKPSNSFASQGFRQNPYPPQQASFAQGMIVPQQQMGSHFSQPSFSYTGPPQPPQQPQPQQPPYMPPQGMPQSYNPVWPQQQQQPPPMAPTFGVGAPVDIFGLADKAASAVQALANQNQMSTFPRPNQQLTQQPGGFLQPMQQMPPQMHQQPPQMHQQPPQMQQQPPQMQQQPPQMQQLPPQMQQMPPQMQQLPPQMQPLPLQMQPSAYPPVGMPQRQAQQFSSQEPRERPRGEHYSQQRRRTFANIMDLPSNVQSAVQNLHSTGAIDGPLDGGMIGMIRDLPESVALTALQKFGTLDKSSMRNKTAYLAGLLRRELEKVNRR